MLCTLESLTKQNAIIPEDIMLNFYQWLTAGKFTPFGVGRTTLKAITNYRKGKPYICSKEQVNGNRSLMCISSYPSISTFSCTKKHFIRARDRRNTYGFCSDPCS